MIAILNWLAEHWFLIFLLFIFGVFESVRDFIMDTLERIALIFGRTKQPPALEPVQELSSVQNPIGLEKKPGSCVHRNVTAVVSPADEVVAWLCKTCDTKLPADWAVREEDL